MFEPRMPGLSSLRAQEKPGVVVGTMKALMPLKALVGSVLA